MDSKNLINNLPNSCWFRSSVYIIEKYVETMKQSDITNNLDGNAVEFLTVNGFYYTSCIPVRGLKDPFAELQINGELPFAF